MRKRGQQGEKKERAEDRERERKVEREGDRRKSSRVQENKTHGYALITIDFHTK